MSCCGSGGSQKPLNNHKHDETPSQDRSTGKTIMIWGVVIALIAGLLVMFL